MRQVIPGIGGEVLMHVFAGGDSEYADAGEFLFTLVATDEFDPWQPIPGDVTGDGSVTMDDIDIILANMGLEGPDLTTFDGDLNGDGVVDGLDLAIALDNLGTQLLDVIWTADGRPLVMGGGGEQTSSWRVPIGPSPGCTGDPTGLCCCPCEGSQCQCSDCDDDDVTITPCADPCDEDCPTRWCNPDCDPDSGSGTGPAYGECHPNCEGSECNEECDHFDACNEECGEDGDGNPYGSCHEECDGSECDPGCEGSDPCAEECEEHGGGPCSDDCEGSECDPGCEGSDPCAEECEEFGGGPCSEDCEGSECDPDCEGSDPCAEECEEFGGGPCSEDCEGSECDPSCEGFDPCAEECESEGFGPCSEECEGSECDPGCEGSTPCDPSCEEFGGGPCGPACESAVCDPACDTYNPCHPACEEFGDGPCSEACQAIPFDPEDGMRLLLVEEQAVLLDIPQPGSVTVDGLVLNAAGEIELWRGQTIEPGQVIVEAFIANNGNDVAFILLDGGVAEQIEQGATVSVGRKTDYVYPGCALKCLRGTCGSGFFPDTWIDSRCFCKCWADAQGSTSWLDDLPDCPCVLAFPGPMNPDPDKWTNPDAPICCHPGAEWCFRSKCSLNPNAPGQQCCYDEHGMLITVGAGAGTPDIVAPCWGIGHGDHYLEDVAPWRHCRDAGRLDCYLKHRPPNKGDNGFGAECMCWPSDHPNCINGIPENPCD